jgi:hypothetical protein
VPTLSLRASPTKQRRQRHTGLCLIVDHGELAATHFDCLTVGWVATCIEHESLRSVARGAVNTVDCKGSAGLEPTRLFTFWYGGKIRLRRQTRERAGWMDGGENVFYIC